MREGLINRLQAMIIPLLDEDGVVLFDMAVGRRGPVVHILLLVDRPEGGITIDQCAGLNHEITQKIDETGLMTSAYTLELSSPGADRPLTAAKDFRRVINEQVRIVLAEPVDNVRECIGEVKDVSDTGVVILRNGVAQMIPFDKIQKAEQRI